MKHSYQELGYAHNPFSGLSEEERAHNCQAQYNLDALECCKPGNAYLFIGDMGRGKSTHLRKLREQYPDAPYLYFPPDHRQPRFQSGLPLYFIDEMQRMRCASRLKILRPSENTLVIATHADHSWWLRLSGYQTQVLHIGGYTVEEVLGIVRTKESAARLAHNAIHFELSREAIIDLYEEYGDNIRAIEKEAYDLYVNARNKS